MQFWDEIIQTAMLGSGKKMPEAALLPVEIQSLAAHIQQQNIDREEQVLQIASLAFNYRQCGVAALQKTDITITKAAEEEKQYAGNVAMQALNEAVDVESFSLLQSWLTLCNDRQQVVVPDVVPAMLNLAVQNKTLRTVILNVCGKRGQWLCQFNKEWNFAIADTAEEIWQTGALEQRKQVLVQLRSTDTTKALEWLQQTWSQEDANTKLELLPALETGISESDMPFLESLSGENSKKVKALAVSLLKKIPSSPIVQQYGEIVRQSIIPKKEKALFGLSSKTTLTIQLQQPTEDIFKSGIEKLSSNKEMPDDLFILSQLMQYVTLSLYEEWWKLTPQEIIELFQREPGTKKLLPALVQACAHFEDKRWAILLMQYSSTFYLDILPLLPATQQEFYSNKFFASHAENIIRYALLRKDEWGLELTRNFFQHAAKNYYQYNRAFFNQQIHLIPLSILPELEKFSPAEEYARGAWANITQHVTKLLQIKQRINQSFNA